MFDSTEAVLRLLLVFALAFAVGLERQVRRKPVGFGTFIFVSTGAATLTLLAITIEEENPLPLLGGVITGIGFLGAGALIRSNDRVFGFTTAALVWAVVVTDRVLEGKGFGSHAKVVRVTVANPVTPEELDALLPAGLTHFERVHVDKEAHRVNVTAEVRIRPAAVASLLESLRSNDKVRAFELE